MYKFTKILSLMFILFSFNLMADSDPTITKTEKEEIITEKICGYDANSLELTYKVNEIITKIKNKKFGDPKVEDAQQMCLFLWSLTFLEDTDSSKINDISTAIVDSYGTFSARTRTDCINRCNTSIHHKRSSRNALNIINGCFYNATKNIRTMNLPKYYKNHTDEVPSGKESIKTKAADARSYIAEQMTGILQKTNTIVIEKGKVSQGRINQDIEKLLKKKIKNVNNLFDSINSEEENCASVKGEIGSYISSSFSSDKATVYVVRSKDGEVFNWSSGGELPSNYPGYAYSQYNLKQEDFDEESDFLYDEMTEIKELIKRYEELDCEANKSLTYTSEAGEWFYIWKTCENISNEDEKNRCLQELLEDKDVLNEKEYNQLASFVTIFLNAKNNNTEAAKGDMEDMVERLHELFKPSTSNLICFDYNPYNVSSNVNNDVLKDKNLLDLNRKFTPSETILFFNNIDITARGVYGNHIQRACVVFNRIKNTETNNYFDFLENLIAKEIPVEKEDEEGNTITEDPIYEDKPFKINMNIVSNDILFGETYNEIRDSLIDNMAGALKRKDDKKLIELINLLCFGDLCNGNNGKVGLSYPQYISSAPKDNLKEKEIINQLIGEFSGVETDLKLLDGKFSETITPTPVEENDISEEPTKEKKKEENTSSYDNIDTVEKADQRIALIEEDLNNLDNGTTNEDLNIKDPKKEKEVRLKHIVEIITSNGDDITFTPEQVEDLFIGFLENPNFYNYEATEEENIKALEDYIVFRGYNKATEDALIASSDLLYKYFRIVMSLKLYDAYLSHEITPFVKKTVNNTTGRNQGNGKTDLINDDNYMDIHWKAFEEFQKKGGELPEGSSENTKSQETEKGRNALFGVEREGNIYE